MIRWIWCGRRSISASLRAADNIAISGVLVSGSGQNVGGGDALDDPPLRGGRPVIGCDAFCEIDGLTDATGGEQTAEANLPNGECVKQDFLPCREEFMTLNALPGGRVEQLRLPGLGGGAGEQDQPEAPLRAGWSSICRDCRSRTIPGRDMAGFAEFVAVHAQHEREQFAGR